METGAAGDNGRRVQSLVAADYKTSLDYATTLLHPMVAKNAEERVNEHVCVTRSLALLTENGVPGSNGAFARPPVDWVLREGSALVITPARPIKDESALAGELKRAAVTVVPVQLTESGVPGKSGIPVPSPVVAEFRS